MDTGPHTYRGHCYAALRQLGTCNKCITAVIAAAYRNGDLSPTNLPTKFLKHKNHLARQARCRSVHQGPGIQLQPVGRLSGSNGGRPKCRDHDLLHGHRLCEISGLVNIVAFGRGHLAGKDLKGHRRH